VVIAGHAFVQNLRRGHYEPGVDARPAPPHTALGGVDDGAAIECFKRLKARDDG
jgi:hypothetical protein